MAVMNKTTAWTVAAVFVELSNGVNIVEWTVSMVEMGMSVDVM